MSGGSLADIAHEWSCSEQEACERLQPGGASCFPRREDGVRRVPQYGATMIESDRHPHPRLWGTFPRVLGHYARELGLVPLEEAVHRMTGLSASRFKLAERSEIAVGKHADLVVFNPDRVIDRPTYKQPALPAGGIDSVMVEGRMTYEAERATGIWAGRFLGLGTTS